MELIEYGFERCDPAKDESQFSLDYYKITGRIPSEMCQLY
jgi:hypothetical protein